MASSVLVSIPADFRMGALSPLTPEPSLSEDMVLRKEMNFPRHRLTFCNNEHAGKVGWTVSLPQHERMLSFGGQCSSDSVQSGAPHVCLPSFTICHCCRHATFDSTPV